MPTQIGFKFNDKREVVMIFAAPIEWCALTMGDALRLSRTIVQFVDQHATPMNDAQVAALKEVFERGPIVPEGKDKAMEFIDFRCSVLPMLGGDGAVTVAWQGMILAIEKDGHVHS